MFFLILGFVFKRPNESLITINSNATHIACSMYYLSKGATIHNLPSFNLLSLKSFLPSSRRDFISLHNSLHKTNVFLAYAMITLS